jgi:two-component sensor histidine kinase
MVDDLLDVSRLESGLLSIWRRNVQVKDIVKRVEPILRQRAQVRKIELVVECESDLPDVYCDADKAGRVITNLAVNAIKFAGECGRVRLWAEADPAGRQVVVGVTDNGPGIDKDSLGDIFERFRQLNSHVKSTVKGFGIGLNIAQQFSRLNLGEVSVQSEVGKGSTFSFTIPMAEPREVLCRWLTLRGTSADSLLLIEIAVDDDVNSAAADELDSFLYCLLRSTDLLIRIASRKWLLAVSVCSSESDIWFRRAEREFERHNRNRPMGPLPNYRAETRCNWNASDKLDSILQQFDAVVRQTNEEPSVV